MTTNIKPTRIIEEPSIVKRHKRTERQIHCDNGQAYSLTQLARTIGIAPATLTWRLETYGWQHPGVLAPIAKPSAGQKSNFTHLDSKARNTKLHKMPSPTKFDRMFG